MKNKSVLWLCGLAVLFSCQMAAGATITNITITTGEATDKIIIHTDDPQSPKIFFLAEPPRMVIDLVDQKLAIDAARSAVETPRIKGMRYAQFSADPLIARVAIDIKQEFPYRSEIGAKSVTVILGSPGKETAEPKEMVIPETESKKPSVKKAAKLKPTMVLKFPNLRKHPRTIICVNGDLLDLPQEKVFVKNTFMVKGSDLLRKLRFTVLYGAKEKTLSGKREDGLEIRLKVGSTKMSLNEEGKNLPEAPILLDGKLYLPLKAVVQELGYGAVYDARKKTLYLAPRITDLRYEVVQGMPRIVVEASDVITPQEVVVMKGPDRLVLDIPQAIYTATKEAISIKENSLLRLRGTQWKPDCVRIVVELEQLIPYVVAAQPYLKEVDIDFPSSVYKVTTQEKPDYVEVAVDATNPVEFKARKLHNPDRIVVDIPNALYALPILTDVHKGAVQRIRGSQFTRTPLATRLVIDLAKDVPFEATLSPTRQQVIIKVGIPPGKVELVPGKPVAGFKGKVIVVDAGHGGKDPGAFGAGGTAEKEMTLDTVLRLAKLLSNAGATVLLTREDDSDTNLKAIVEFANNNRADLFVSVHYNAFEQWKIKGTETYYYNIESKPLAVKIHQRLTATLDEPDRNVMSVRYYVLRHTTMPAVLIEPAYLTNPDEERLIRSEDFRQKVAEATFLGIKDYLENK